MSLSEGALHYLMKYLKVSSPSYAYLLSHNIILQNIRKFSQLQRLAKEEEEKNRNLRRNFISYVDAVGWATGRASGL